MDKILEYSREFNSYWTNRFKVFLNDSQRTNLCDEHQQSRIKNNVDTEFNLFTLISKTYHHENYHSDILKVFLQSNSFQKGYGYMHLFLKYLNTIGAKINLYNYGNPEVYREKGKVDLLIVDKTSKKAIIIENKMNNASDMHRQIPRYVEYVQRHDWECDCIVYISLNKTKLPVTYEWSKQEIDYVRSKIVYSIAYKGDDKDLYNGWITKAERITTNIDALMVLRQYGALVKQIGGNIMNKVIVEKFYEDILNVENFKNALSIKHMLGDLILFRAERLVEFFKLSPAPFNNVVVWNGWVAVLMDYLIDEHHWSIDVRVLETEYHFEFWDRLSDNPIGAQTLVSRMELLDETYAIVGPRIRKVFEFPQQEDELVNYVVMFKEKLIEATKSN